MIPLAWLHEIEADRSLQIVVGGPAPALILTRTPLPAAAVPLPTRSPRRQLSAKRRPASRIARRLTARCSTAAGAEPLSPSPNARPFPPLRPPFSFHSTLPPRDPDGSPNLPGPFSKLEFRYKDVSAHIFVKSHSQGHSRLRARAFDNLSRATPIPQLFLFFFSLSPRILFFSFAAFAPLLRTRVS